MSNYLSKAGIILVGPRYPENIGATARIAYNFGLSGLTIVSDKEFDRERMAKMATHKAAHLIENMRTVKTTREAAEPFNLIIGTTARLGRQRQRVDNPRIIMDKAARLYVQDKIQIGLMFGPENSGLTNDDLDLCQLLSTIPTADFSSLNLAQAVAIHCYELYMAIPKTEQPLSSNIEYANSFDLEGMYDHIQEALTEITFIEGENKTYWMKSIRNFLGRVRLSKKEATIIRGVCRKFIWHNKADKPARNSFTAKGE